MAAYRWVYDSRNLLTAKNQNQFRKPTLGNRVWATFLYADKVPLSKLAE